MITELVDIYIKRYERRTGREVKSFAKYMVKDFAAYLEQELAPHLQSNGLQVPDSTAIKDSRVKVAFISEETGHLTGGRYYAWFMAVALAELGYDITLYTNQTPTYDYAFKDYKRPKVKLVDKNKLALLDVEADLYIGSPRLGNVAVCNLSTKYKKPGYCMIFDPLPMIEKYLGTKHKGWEDLTLRIRNSDVNIISLCDATKPYMGDWLNKRPHKIFTIYPCINSRELSRAGKNVSQGDYVIFISRLVKHKKFEDVLEAVKGTSMRLKVVSSVDGVKAEEMVKKMGMQDRVDFYYNLPDKEKFDMIYGAKAMINGAIFEGFGMWAAEAISCGIPLVCYDYVTLKEIVNFANAENVYFAKWNDPKDLTKQLKKALKEDKRTKGIRVFDFVNMISKVKEVFTPDPKIGVVTIALNEQQYIGASLRSVIKHPNIAKVIVVEGAVNLFAHAASKVGLSVDKTGEEIEKVMKESNGHKITYDRMGWSKDKAELRNHALQLLPDDIDYVLVVDADEVWKQEDLNRLVAAMKQHPENGVFLFKHLHFWKQKDLIAVGSQWDSLMFRCFKFKDKTLKWKRHELPVINDKGWYIHKTDGVITLDNVWVYHYGYLKEEKRIIEKLEYYKKRDRHLQVKNTWTDWKPGRPTQPTHGNGTVEKFKGTHPEEVQNII